ncbi:unnamed protein product [Tilletia laevis]|nr:unnamed protein product [Tilletia controversa]CAD6957424.1 unnamed protein product [Tilletia laevis]CAD6981583.1 unnamed protein product [Tilletia controversa]
MYNRTRNQNRGKAVNSDFRAFGSTVSPSTASSSLSNAKVPLEAQDLNRDDEDIIHDAPDSSSSNRAKKRSLKRAEDGTRR